MEKIEKKIRIAALNTERIENQIWFAAVEKNGLYRMDLQYENPQFVTYFEDEKLSQDILYSDVKEYDGKLIFSPQKAKNIAIYDISCGKMELVKLPDINKNNLNEIYNDEIKCNKIIQYKDKIYILGHSYPGIIKYQNGKVTLIDNWIKRINEFIPSGDLRGYTTEGYCIKNNHIYIPVGGCPCLLDLNADTDSVEIINIKCCFDGVGGLIELPDGRVALIGRGQNANKIVYWDIEKNECCDIEISPKLQDIGFAFQSPVIYKNQLYLFPLVGHTSIFRINLDDNAVYEIPLDEIININELKDGIYPWVTMAVSQRENIVSFITGANLLWHELNMDTDEILNYEVIHEQTFIEYRKKFVEEAVREKKIINESREASLQTLIKVI